MKLCEFVNELKHKKTNLIIIDNDKNEPLFSARVGDFIYWGNYSKYINCNIVAIGTLKKLFGFYLYIKVVNNNAKNRL